MDHTIEVWTMAENHYAECSCGWRHASHFQPVIEAFVKNHRKDHAANGDSTEVV